MTAIDDSPLRACERELHAAPVGAGATVVGNKLTARVASSADESLERPGPAPDRIGVRFEFARLPDERPDIRQDVCEEESCEPQK